MLNRIYKYFFGNSQIFATEVNDDMRVYIKSLTDMIDNIDGGNDMIKYQNDIEIGLEKHTRDIGIEDVQELHSEVSGFLYNYQRAIPFDKTIYIQDLKPANKYCFKKGFRIKKENDFYKEIIYEKWVSEAILFLNGEKEFTKKLLGIYSKLDYFYNYPTHYDRKIMEKWKFTMNKDGIFENNYDEKRTLYEILGGLITYQEGIYNDNRNTREWGLYNSSFYHIVLNRVLINIVYDIEKAIKMDDHFIINPLHY